MGKIGDIWVRLGLKKEGFTKGIEDAKKETRGFGQTLGGIKAGAVAVWAAIGTAVVKFGQEMLSATNRIGDAWNRTTVQMKAGWDVFLQSLSTWNWDNFIGKIKESAAAAKELQNALDFEFEATNSINLQKSAYAEELASLQIEMRDATKSYEERAAAAQKYLSIVKPIYQQEIDLRKQLMEANMSKWLAGSGLQDTEENRRNLANFLVDYGKNQDLIDAVTTYNDKNASREDWEKARDYLFSYGEQTGNYAAASLARIYETMRGDEDTQPLVDSIIAYNNAKAAYDQETRRVQSSLNTALAGIQGGTESGTSAEIPAPEGSRAALQAEIEAAQKAAANAVGEQAMAQADAVVRALQERLQAMDMRSQTVIALEQGTLPAEIEIVLPEENLNFNDKIDLKQQKIDVPELTSGMQDYTSSIYESANALGVLGGAVSNITALVDGGAASWISYGTNILQTVAQAIPAIASLTSAKNAEATANTASMVTGAGSSVASIPYVGPIMAVAAIANVLAAIANLPKFATGGIVGGHSFYGDKILARLNSGEMVLSQAQQASLYGALDRPVQDLHLTGQFGISGRDLRLTIDKYDTYRRQ